jgi:hypothetical protein
LILAGSIWIRITEKLGMKDTCKAQFFLRKLQIMQLAVRQHVVQLRKNATTEAKESGKKVSYFLRRIWLARWSAEEIQRIEMDTPKSGTAPQIVGTLKQLWHTPSEIKLVS